MLRVVSVVSLLGLLFGLCVWYGAAGPVPVQAASDSAVVDTAADADTVAVKGRVVDSDPVTIRVTSGREPVYIEIENAPRDVTEGETLRVLGTRLDRTHIRASTVIVTPRYGLSYAYAVSFLAGLWVLYRFVRDWQVDHQGVIHRRRPFGGPSDSSGRHTSREGDPDA